MRQLLVSAIFCRAKKAFRVRLTVADLINRNDHFGQRQACGDDAGLSQLSPGGGHDRPSVPVQLKDEGAIQGN